MWEDSKVYRENNPEKIYCHKVVNIAIKNGELTRLPCAKCGKNAKTQAHHTDYSKPLDVTWLCASCHSREHRLARGFHRASTKESPTDLQMLKKPRAIYERSFNDHSEEWSPVQYGCVQRAIGSYFSNPREANELLNKGDELKTPFEVFRKRYA